LRKLLEPLPPGIVMVRHMREKFARFFAGRLDSSRRVRVFTGTKMNGRFRYHERGI
jgi:chemotaxis response regulator CheB